MKKFYILFYKSESDTHISQEEIMAGSMGLALQEFEANTNYEAKACYPEDLKLTFTAQSIPFAYQRDIEL